jgi:hypothetical protein
MNLWMHTVKNKRFINTGFRGWCGPKSGLKVREAVYIPEWGLLVNWVFEACFFDAGNEFPPPDGVKTDTVVYDVSPKGAITLVDQFRQFSPIEPYDWN